MRWIRPMTACPDPSAIPHPFAGNPHVTGSRRHDHGFRRRRWRGLLHDGGLRRRRGRRGAGRVKHIIHQPVAHAGVVQVNDVRRIKRKTVCELMIWLMMTSRSRPPGPWPMSARPKGWPCRRGHKFAAPARATRLLLLVYLVSNQAAGNHACRRANQGALAAIPRSADGRACNRANGAAHQGAGAGVVRRAFRCVTTCHQHRDRCHR